MNPTRLFAYGTLQPGRLRWPFLAPFATGHGPAEVPGALYDSGHGWPVAVFVATAAGPGTTDGPPMVPGTLVDLDAEHLAMALARLDEVEVTATDLLQRIVVTTAAGDAAWAYHCRGSTVGMTRITRWSSRHER